MERRMSETDAERIARLEDALRPFAEMGAIVKHPHYGAWWNPFYRHNGPDMMGVQFAGKRAFLTEWHLRLAFEAMGATTTPAALTSHERFTGSYADSFAA
jgi:hypothetical protein